MTDLFTKLKTLSSRYGNPNPSDSATPVQPIQTDRAETKVDRSLNGVPSSVNQHPKGLLKRFSAQTSRRMARLIRRNGSLPPEMHGQRPLYRQWWAWSVVGVGFGVGGAVLAVQATISAIEQELPNTTEALTFNRTGTLTIKADDGSVLQQMGPATRDKITLQQMPELLPEAFVSSEDQEFYKHGGVDYQAIVRATLKNLTAGEVVEGGSTITQQLARIVFLDQERSLGRKLKEALLAQKMERELGKDQILERYLNLVYLGSSAYGVADAAWIYFSKPVNKLTLSEMAMIAGMAPAPSVYSPLVNPNLAKQRRNIVLERMVDAGYITPSQRDAAMAEPIALKPSTPKNLYSLFPYFTSYIQQQLPAVVSPEELEMGGLTVETTLNPKWQKEAQDVIKYAINNYGPYEGFAQASLVSVDPRTGAIKALVGGDDFEKSQFNRATQAQRQPGSTFKMFVYSTAIAAGFSPYTSYMDAKLVVDGYEPQNYSKKYQGMVTIRDALINSINIVAVKTLIDVGFDPVIEMAKRMGIKSKLLPSYSLALGTSEVNLLELTSAYGTLANKGNHIAAHGITRVLDRFGKVIYQADFKPQQAIDKDSAAVMSWMLQGVVDNGTGADAILPDRPVAGKTGTSEKRRDLWFVGYIPQLVTGVWLGNDDSSPTDGASSTAARTWYDFMSTLTDEIPVEQFPELPPLGEWEGSIKAKPVNPKRLYEASAPDNSGSSDEESSDWGYEDNSSYNSYDSYGSGSSESGYSSSESGSSSSEESSAPAPEAAPPTPAPEGVSEPAPSTAPREEAPANAPPAEAAPPAFVQEAPPAPIDAPPPMIDTPPPADVPPLPSEVVAPVEQAPANSAPAASPSN